MEFTSRRDQFSYFLGFAARRDERALKEALRRYADAGYRPAEPLDAFEQCPYNDPLAQVTRGVLVYENAQRPELINQLHDAVGEFVFLVSDFEPPCCGDGRTFYERTSSQQVVLTCDRCGSSYALDEQPTRPGTSMRMTRPEFAQLCGDGTAELWPDHHKLRALLSAGR